MTIDVRTIDRDYGVPEHLEHRLPLPDGRTLAVAEWGDPNGKPVITFHGTPGSRIGYWTDEPGIWKRFGLRRLSFDRPGYGDSTRLPGRSVADVVPDVVAIADALGLRRFTISGGSGGGPHVLACAALIPDRVIRCLSSVTPAPIDAEGVEFLAGMNEGNVREYGAAQEGEAVLRPILEKTRDEMIEALTSGRADFLGEGYDMPEADRIEMEKQQKASAAHLLTAIVPGIDGWVDDDLAFVRPWGFDVTSCRVPVVLAYGRQDVLVPAAHGDWLAERVPNAVTWIDDDTGHMGNSAQVERDLAWLRDG
jgi:pimeloyl-ACP methyl ester carboxylesterase